MYLAELCGFSKDPQIHFKVGQEKTIPPAMQVLARPFSIAQIYKLLSRFYQYYNGSSKVEVVSVGHHSAIIRYTPLLVLQSSRTIFDGRAWFICQNVKEVTCYPSQDSSEPTCATILDRKCLAEGDAYCSGSSLGNQRNGARSLPSR
jgi:hypothetical protein